MDYAQDKALLNHLVAADEERLLELMGEELIKQAGYAGPKTPKAKRDEARSWYQLRRDSILDVVCRHIAPEPMHSSEIEVATLIIDTFAHLTFHLPVPAAALSLFLAKQGIPKLCATRWAKTS